MEVQWPEHKAWLAGEITSNQSYEISLRREIKEQRRIYRECADTAPASSEHHRKQMCCAISRLRALRRK